MTTTKDKHPFQQNDGGNPVEITIQLTENTLWSLLTGAFEGGSNYWIEKVEILPSSREDMKAKHTYLQDVPFLGGTLLITPNQNPGDTRRKPHGKKLRWALDLHDLRWGLNVMAKLKPGEGGHHFPDLIAGNDDGTTADVFLQCTLFGGIYFT